MAFQIKDKDEVTALDQARWMETDINALVQGIAAEGVLTGCTVTAQGSPDMTCAVAAGEVFIGGVKVLVAAGNVTITAAHATLPRIDLVVVSNAGAKSVTAGTAAASPKAPDIPANSILLAMVYVAATDTAINSGEITDKRLMLRPVVAEGRTKFSGTAQLSLPGVEIISQATAARSAARLYYEPVLVKTPITLDQLLLEVTVAGAGATTARMGIYYADTDWQPLTLVVDAGTVAVDSTGVKTASISVTLQPGRYLFAYHSDGAPTLRLLNGGTRYTGLAPALGGSAFISQTYVNTAYAAYAATGVAWAAIITASIPFSHAVVCRISTP